MNTIQTNIIEPMAGDVGVTVTEVKVYTEDGDLVNHHYDVYVRGELRHSKCDQLGVINALGSYVNALMFQMR